MKTKNWLLIPVMLILLLACSFPLGGEVQGDEETLSQPETESEEGALSPIPNPGNTQTYYIRPDGGTAEECTGLADAPYPGGGSSQACAWSHPFIALPPGDTARIHGGDTLLIAAGSYRMGIDAPNTENCEAGGSFDCHIPSIPSGPDPAHPTRILGAGWENGCPAPPELWGAERAWFILNLTGSSNVEIGCMEITDHSGCIEAHSSSLTCQRENSPYGDWAASGIHAEDSSNVYLHHLNIHGLANNGIHAGRLTDWTLEDVRIAANGWAGWDGDLWDDGGDANHGVMTFRRVTVEWNGCGETFPRGEISGCWAQEAGGYGDGFAPGETGGDWVIEDSAFLHNTSDGIDLLYHQLGGSVLINRVHAEGNAGNQIKVTGNTQITNSLLVGNCAFFDEQPFTFQVDACRALGNTLEIVYMGGEQVSITNSTLYGQGDGLIVAGPREETGLCNASETLNGYNNIFLGAQDYFDPEDIPFLFYQEGCNSLRFEGDYNIAYNVKNIDSEWSSPPFPGGNNLYQDPLLTGPFSGESFGMQLAAGSPAIDSAEQGVCPTVDLSGAPRPWDGNNDNLAGCDRGAYEALSPTPAAGQAAIEPTASTDPDKWSLWTDGAQLRGANIWSRLVVPELDGDEFLGGGHVGPPYTQQDFDALAALGANYVNLSHPGLFTETPLYVPDEDAQTHLDSLLEMAANAHLYAVITFRTGPGRSDFTFYSDGAGDWFDPELLREWVWSDQAAQDAWVEMWRYTAERYRTNPAVVGYDLMCEPNSSGILDIYEPEEFYAAYAGTLYDWNQFYPRMVEAIREVDSETPILVGGLGWSGLRWLPYLQPVDAERIVYIAHQYEPQAQYTHQEEGGGHSYPGEFDLDWDGEADSFNRDWLVDYLSILAEFRAEHNAPVAVNEFGIARWVPGAAAFMSDQMDLFEEFGVNYALWAWSPGWEPYATSVTDFNFLYGPDPQNVYPVPNSLQEVIVNHWERNTDN